MERESKYVLTELESERDKAFLIGSQGKKAFRDELLYAK